MDPSPNHEVTRLLQAWSSGDPQASDQLMPLIYEHLRGLAREYLRRERAGHTLQPTALVHEAYVRLADDKAITWQGRAHFFSVAARAMRRILVDHARGRSAAKRGGGVPRVELQEDAVVFEPAEDKETDLVALDAALIRLSAVHPRPSQVVELHFFGGMEMRDIAEVLQVTDRTIKRDWQFARLWLQREVDQAVSANEY